MRSRLGCSGSEASNRQYIRISGAKGEAIKGVTLSDLYVEPEYR